MAIWFVSRQSKWEEKTMLKLDIFFKNKLNFTIYKKCVDMWKRQREKTHDTKRLNVGRTEKNERKRLTQRKINKNVKKKEEYQPSLLMRVIIRYAKKSVIFAQDLSLGIFVSGFHFKLNQNLIFTFFYILSNSTVDEIALNNE